VRAWVSSQLGLLAHDKVSVFVSHCGVNSAYEAVLLRTPLVCIPLMADQKDMAMRLVGSITHVASIYQSIILVQSHMSLLYINKSLLVQSRSRFLSINHYWFNHACRFCQSIITGSITHVASIYQSIITGSIMQSVSVNQSLLVQSRMSLSVNQLLFALPVLPNTHSRFISYFVPHLSPLIRRTPAPL
jgi:UDP-N-acetylglucosamine transferase subunit ALG13